jgi:AcrR family transcriptional regulator
VREQKKQDTLSRILDSALIHFAEKGFEAASVRDICADAGVTHALIRLHFGSKELLWQAAVDYLFERMNQEMALPPGEPRMREGLEGLKAFARRYVKYCARHPEHARLMLQESMHRNDRLRYAVRKHISSAHEFMYAGVKKAVANGDMPRISPISFIYILSAASQMVFALAEEAREIYQIDVLSDEFVAQHTDAVIKLLFRK